MWVIQREVSCVGEGVGEIMSERGVSYATKVSYKTALLLHS